MAYSVRSQLIRMIRIYRWRRRAMKFSLKIASVRRSSFPRNVQGEALSVDRSSASSSSSAAFSFHRGGTDSLARELKSLSCRTSPAVSRRRSSGSTRAAKVDHQRERFPLRVARGKPVPICISVIPHRSHNRLHLEENTVLV